MIKLKELIAKMCPNGVAFYEVGNLCKTLTPTIKVKVNQYLEEGTYPVIDQGQEFIGGYTNEENVFPEDEYIVFGDHTCVVKYVNFAFAQGADGVKVLSADRKLVIPRYLFHCMANIKMDVSYARHWSKMKVQKVPVPPIEVQCEVIRILDNFTKLTTELIAELNARKQQYKYYREEIISNEKGLKMVSIGDICDVVIGGEAPSDCIKGELPDESHPYAIWANGREVYGYTSTYTVEGDSVCISSIGANTGAVFFHKGKFTPIIRLKVLVPKVDYIDNRYLYHAVSTINFAPKKSSVPNMSAADIKKATIPLPSLEKQKQIREILDCFDGLCDDKENGIPAEIAARQKQYEYCRNQVLSFKEA